MQGSDSDSAIKGICVFDYFDSYMQNNYHNFRITAVEHWKFNAKSLKKKTPF